MMDISEVIALVALVVCMFLLWPLVTVQTRRMVAFWTVCFWVCAMVAGGFGFGWTLGTVAAALGIAFALWLVVMVTVSQLQKRVSPVVSHHNHGPS